MALPSLKRQIFVWMQGAERFILYNILDILKVDNKKNVNFNIRTDKQ